MFARDDDYFFGVLHSRIHELWALRTGHAAARSRERLPLHPHHHLRDLPLPLAARAGAGGRPARRGHRGGRARSWWRSATRGCNPAGASEAELKKRTLTNLYNARPTWLDLAHRKLDAAVLAAYGWPHDLSDEEILERLLALNLERRSNG